VCSAAGCPLRARPTGALRSSRVDILFAAPEQRTRRAEERDRNFDEARGPRRSPVLAPSDASSFVHLRIAERRTGMRRRAKQRGVTPLGPRVEEVIELRSEGVKRGVIDLLR
jgi:hypothetical protein